MSAIHEHSQRGNVDVDGAPSLLDRPHPLAMVYGGGGVFGIAYGAGVAHGLIDSGIRADVAPALGTSAGSWVASAVALDIPYSALDEMGVPRVPNGRRGILAGIAREIFGETTHRNVAVSAVGLRTRRRHIFDGGTFPLADLIAASSAVPGFFPPHKIDGRLYIDGGMWSATSVDAAADAREVIVVAPLAGSTLGPVGRSAGALLQRELDRWSQRHPGHTITLIRPNDEIARLAGRTPLGLFDASRARTVYPLAYEQGRRWGERMHQAGAEAA